MSKKAPRHDTCLSDITIPPLTCHLSSSSPLLKIRYFRFPRVWAHLFILNRQWDRSNPTRYLHHSPRHRVESFKSIYTITSNSLEIKHHHQSKRAIKLVKAKAKMIPELTLPAGHASSAADRRLNALLRHLSSSAMDTHNSVSPLPTSSFQYDSVFSHVVQAPEDPILGVLRYTLPFYIIIVFTSL